MSYYAWQHDFGGDPSVVNANFAFEGFAFKVVGIAPPGFYGDSISTTPPALWIPLQTEYLTDADASYNQVHSSAWLRLIGRLRPGARLAGVSSELTAFLQHWLVSDADVDPIHLREVEQTLPQQKIEIASAATGVSGIRDRFGNSLKILLAVCIIVLLIGCANVANLLLARGMTRRAEVSIMSALGASGARLIQRALTESLVLALLGGVVGVFLAVAGTNLMVLLAFGHANGTSMHVGLSWPMLGFCATVALLSGTGTGPGANGVWGSRAAIRIYRSGRPRQ